ncbi:hypothetical protein U1Q18_027914 [Sarracenia purpurea var. burkii]
MGCSNSPTWGSGSGGLMHIRVRKRKMRLSLMGNRKGVQKKLKQLKMLIPGGREMETAESVFQTTANYISLLQWRVSVLRSTVSALYALNDPKDSSAGSINAPK